MDFHCTCVEPHIKKKEIATTEYHGHYCIMIICSFCGGERRVRNEKIWRNYIIEGKLRVFFFVKRLHKYLLQWKTILCSILGKCLCLSSTISSINTLCFLSVFQVQLFVILWDVFIRCEQKPNSVIEILTWISEEATLEAYRYFHG